MNKVVIITTGGTIAMTTDRESQSVKPTDPHLLKKALPLLNDYAVVEMDDFANLPSVHITPDIMLKLSERIQTYINRPDVNGIVITHGTDTLEETAYFLDLVLPSTKPVVVTGAMRGFDERGSDGPLNMLSAVRVAAEPASAGKGVLVVFNEEVHAARWVTKTHTSNVAAFRSPQNGPIGIVTKTGPLFYSIPLGQVALAPINRITANVVIIKAAAGTDDLFFRAALDADVDGIVLEALGQGNIPPQMIVGVKNAVKNGTPVVVVSRSLSGIVQDVYGYEGGGKQLKDLGVIFSNGLSAQKARIKLILALSKTKDTAELSRLFSDKN